MIEIDNIFWFRHDLRVLDNTPLYMCSKTKKSAAIYIYDPSVIENESFSNYHLDFINDSLFELSETFKNYGAHLNIYYGESSKVLKKLLIITTYEIFIAIMK